MRTTWAINVNLVNNILLTQFTEYKHILLLLLLYTCSMADIDLTIRLDKCWTFNYCVQSANALTIHKVHTDFLPLLQFLSSNIEFQQIFENKRTLPTNQRLMIANYKIIEYSVDLNNRKGKEGKWSRRVDILKDFKIVKERERENYLLILNFEFRRK